MSSMAPRINGFSICLFRCKSKKTTKLCVTGLCERKPPVTGGFPSQRASNAEKGYIWWRHHGMILLSPSRLLVWTHGPLFTKTPSYCSGSAGASVVAHSVALPHIEIAFSTLDCSIVPALGALLLLPKHGPLKQSWAGIQHSRDDEPLGVLMQMRNVRVNGFFFFFIYRALKEIQLTGPWTKHEVWWNHHTIL